MQTIKLQRQAKNRSTANLSAPFITTSDLFKHQPIFSRLILPHDKWSVKHFQVNNVDSLPVPAFVNLDNSNRWFYQKFSGIWHEWDYFITDSIHKEETPTLPTINPVLLTALFVCFHNAGKCVDTPYATENDVFPLNGTVNVASIDYAAYTDSNFKNKYPYCSVCDRDPVDMQNYDFVVRWVDGDTIVNNCYKLSYRGRLIYNVLVSLGYTPLRLLVLNLVDGKYELDTTFDSLPLLPLMAYMNIYKDNFIPQKFRQPYNDLMEFYYSADNLYSYFLTTKYRSYPSSFQFKATSVYQLERLVYGMSKFYYGNDYFTGSLQEPMNAPGQVLNYEIDVTLESQDDYSKSIVKSGNSGMTPYETPQLSLLNSSQPANITQYILNMLQQVTERTQLQALAPNSMLGRLYAMFGMKGKENDQLATKLAEYSDLIAIRPEIASADTLDSDSDTGRPLGYKAASAGSYRENKDAYNWDFDDYGILICVNSITPEIFYFEGLNREMMLIHSKDYDVENFNTAGYQAIANKELCADQSLLKVLGVNPNGVFGFTSFGANFMSPIARLAGDFAIKSTGADAEVYHSGRFIFPNNLAYEATVMKHMVENGETFALVNASETDSLQVNQYEGHQYDRIFDFQDSKFDHIRQWNYYTISAVRNLPSRGDFSIGDEKGAVRELQALSNVAGTKGAQ